MRDAEDDGVVEKSAKQDEIAPFGGERVAETAADVAEAVHLGVDGEVSRIMKARLRLLLTKFFQLFERGQRPIARRKSLVDEGKWRQVVVGLHGVLFEEDEEEEEEEEEE